MHKLAIVAVIGLSASAVCMGAAAAIGGDQFNRGMDFSMFGDGPRCEAVPGATTSRDLDWDGSDRVSLGLSSRARYTPGSDDKVHVSGDADVIAHVRVRDGNIELNCNNGWHHRTPVNITLPGQEFKKFSIHGSSQLVLQNLDQTMVKIDVSGSGSVKADGKVEHADIRVSGSGDADLSKLKTNIATVRISGSGSSDIAPTDEADIRVSGSGDVNLHTNPKRLETRISGSGRIHNIGS